MRGAVRTQRRGEAPHESWSAATAAGILARSPGLDKELRASHGRTPRTSNAFPERLRAAR